MRERLSRRLRPDGRDGGREGGYTLVELLVTMMVFSIATAMVYAVVIAVQRRVVDVERSAEAVDQVRHALAQIDRQVRSGNVLYSPANEPAHVASCTSTTAWAGSCMRVYTQANGAERCVQWQVLADPARPGSNLLRSRSWAPTWTTGGAVSSWETVARGLVASTVPAPFALEGAATAYDGRLLNVRFEAIDPRRDQPVVITSSLSGRNTHYGYDAGQCTPVPPA